MFSPLDLGISVVFKLGGHCKSCRVYQLSGFRGAADVQVPASPSTIITQRIQSIKGLQCIHKMPEVTVTIANEW